MFQQRSLGLLLLLCVLHSSHGVSHVKLRGVLQRNLQSAKDETQTVGCPVFYRYMAEFGYTARGRAHFIERDDALRAVCTEWRESDDCAKEVSLNPPFMASYVSNCPAAGATSVNHPCGPRNEASWNFQENNYCSTLVSSVCGEGEQKCRESLTVLETSQCCDPHTKEDVNNDPDSFPGAGVEGIARHQEGISLCGWCATDGEFMPDKVMAYTCLDSNSQEMLEQGEDMTKESAQACLDAGAKFAYPLTCGMLDSTYSVLSPTICPAAGFMLSGSCCSNGAKPPPEPSHTCGFCQKSDGTGILNHAKVVSYNCQDEFGTDLQEEGESMSRDTEAECLAEGAASAQGVTCGQINLFVASMNPSHCPAVGFLYADACCDGDESTQPEKCLCEDLMPSEVAQYRCIGANGPNDADEYKQTQLECLALGAEDTMEQTCGVMDATMSLLMPDFCPLISAQYGPTCCKSGTGLRHSNATTCGWCKDPKLFAGSKIHHWECTDADGKDMEKNSEEDCQDAGATYANPVTCGALDMATSLIMPDLCPSLTSVYAPVCCDSEPDSNCLSCGIGTIERNGVCVATAPTCAGLWEKDQQPYYRREHPCQCNGLCKKYGNCCIDYQGSCEKYGWPQTYEPKNSCQCNRLCKKYGNCCDDADNFL